ncbi:MAG: FIG00729359: hypothetical protein [uncultured Sulfurovum sp.]|uniref:DUF4331 domain-containing protein n=1 Tax=uncultured Sulfurovum sp. TaxID=269237 RepID=A0A6S6SUG8_9BACT|nr:MAG: FIG00729359: hypothetical protein [uncultured Sulfurovum sp.]
MSRYTQKISVAALLATTLFTTNLTASSHREAPAITESPKVDATDFYMFNSYETGRTGYTTLIANYVPLQDPQGGPNYFAMDPDAVYDIHVDNNGDSVEDLTFRFRFSNTLEGGTGKTIEVDGKTLSIPLNALGAISASDSSNLGLKETYKVELIKGDRKTGTTSTLATSLTKPYDNVGKKTFPDYNAYANKYIHSVAMEGCSAGNMKVFVGQRKDPFVVNLGETFDLVNYVPVDRSFAPFATAGIEQLDSNDDLRAKNTTAIAIEVPTACLLSDTSKTTIGAWTTASLPQARILRAKGQFDKNSVQGGALTQVSRLSNPLVNEVVIGLKDKDLFNTSEPKDDAQFIDYVTNPTLPVILNALFLDAVNGVTGADFKQLNPTNYPRNDLVAAFLTGIEGVNKNGSVGEMLRLNTGIAATAKANQNAFGVAAGDLAGFPNGRRPGDDVVDLALRVVMGALCHPVAVDLDGSGTAGDAGDVLGLCATTDAVTGTVPYTDGAPVSAMYFNDTFPYLKAPLAGSPN